MTVLSAGDQDRKREQAVFEVYEPSGSADFHATGEQLKSEVEVAFPEYRVREYFAAKPAILDSSDFLVAAKTAQSGELVGLLCGHWCPELHPWHYHSEVYLVAASHQGGTLAFRLWTGLLGRSVEKRGDVPWFLSTRSCNPAVLVMLEAISKRTGARLYPSVSEAGEVADDEDLGALAGRVAALTSPECRFEPQRGVVRNVATPADFYREIPRTKDRRLNAFFTDTLQLEDRVLCLLDVSDPESREAARLMFRVAQKPTGGEG